MGIQRHIKASFGLLLLTGLVAGCATTPPWAQRVPEVIPAQTCGGDIDSDGDGVRECADRCPGSQRGQAIGPDGCPLPLPQQDPGPMPTPKPYRG